MSVFRNVVLVAALAGLIAGAVLAALQAFATVPLILEAETYENAAGHDHGHEAGAGNAPEHEHAAAGDEVGAPGWAPADGIERLAYTVLANTVTGIGFALILVAASELAGGLGSWREGIFWGLAGFASFILAPGLGLPPELPAMPAAELGDRQLWWMATVVATAVGLALIAFCKSLPLAALGVALIVAPHLYGAPQPSSFESPVPEALHQRFVVVVTVTSLVFWVVLGAAAGALRARVVGGPSRMRDSFA